MPIRNRVVDGMEEWRIRENNIKTIFPKMTPDVPFMKQLKLDYLRDLYRDVKKDANHDEKMTLYILKAVIKSEEKELYPGKWERRWQKLKRAVKNLARDKDEPKMSDKTLWMQPAAINKSINERKDTVKEIQRYEPNKRQSIRRNDPDEELKQSQRKGLRL